MLSLTLHFSDDPTFRRIAQVKHIKDVLRCGVASAIFITKGEESIFCEEAHFLLLFQELSIGPYPFTCTIRAVPTPRAPVIFTPQA